MAEKTYQCELCNHVPFKAPTALGRHKLSAHNIPGQSHAAIAYRKAKAKETHGKQQPRTHRASSKAHQEATPALTRTKKTAIQKVRQNHHQHRFDNGELTIPEGALAVAFGRFQELCRSFAFEYDLPPKLFTSRLTQLISASAVR